MRTGMIVSVLMLAAGPASAGEGRVVPAHSDWQEGEPVDPRYGSAGPPGPSYAIDCAESKDTGYMQGNPYEITVVTVDGQKVEVQSANAYYQMAQAAANDGVGIVVVSGFRTNAEQIELYNCYINCNCNECNQAAAPGWSNHQSGHAFDLNTAASGVYDWLNAHGGDWGFTETVDGEPWHWEWWGGGPPASGPCGTPAFKGTFVAQSFPGAELPAVELELEQSFPAWIDLKNEGTATWTANTKLAPTPRDQTSPLFDIGWLSPTRITGPDVDTPPGAVGRFSFELAASALPGEYYQTFTLVEEGVTWFADAAGPADDAIRVRVQIVAPAPSPPPGTTSASAGETASTGGAEGAASASEGTPTSGSGDMSAGTSTDSGPEGTGDPPAAAGGDDGCGCSGPGRGGRGGGAVGALVGLAGLVRRRRRAAATQGHGPRAA